MKRVPTANWYVDLEGRSSVIRPDGSRVPLAYRKVGELLACLAHAPDRKATRDEISRRLWPDTPAADRLTSLRQCLSQVRRALGSGILATDRQTCQLLLSGEIVCSDWTGASTPAEPSSAFGDAMERLSRKDALAALEQLSRFPQQGVGLQQGQFARVLKAVRMAGGLTPEHRGWLRFWEGMEFSTSDVARAKGAYASGRAAGVQLQNWQLVSHAAFWLGISQLLKGETRDAAHTVDHALHHIPVPMTAARARIENLRAHVALHTGDRDQAITLLARLASNSDESAAERASAESLLALYLAYAGQFGAAERILTDLSVADAAPGHNLVASYSSLAESVIRMANRRQGDFARVETLADQFGEARNFHLELYTRELLLVRALEAGKPSYARTQRPRVRQLRKRLALGFTEWDRQRLTPISA